jgi:hypothetical protein
MGGKVTDPFPVGRETLPVAPTRDHSRDGDRREDEADRAAAGHESGLDKRRSAPSEAAIGAIGGFRDGGTEISIA